MRLLRYLCIIGCDLRFGSTSNSTKPLSPRDFNRTNSTVCVYILASSVYFLDLTEPANGSRMECQRDPISSMSALRTHLQWDSRRSRKFEPRRTLGGVSGRFRELLPFYAAKGGIKVNRSRHLIVRVRQQSFRSPLTFSSASCSQLYPSRRELGNSDGLQQGIDARVVTKHFVIADLRDRYATIELKSEQDALNSVK
jgi:hypothetical protein